jgi:hypothetical protein
MSPESSSTPARSMSQSVSQLGSDVMSLLELQAELLQLDIRQCLRAWTGAILLLAVTGIVALASLPVLMLSMAYAIHDMAELSLPLSLLIAAATGLVVAAICAFVSLWLLKRDTTIMSRSAAEFRRNVRWLKAVLQGPAFAGDRR